MNLRKTTFDNGVFTTDHSDFYKINTNKIVKQSYTIQKNSMKNILAIAAIILINSNLFAAKSYSLTIKTYSLATQETLAGLKVSIDGKKKKTVIGFTNEKGEILVTALSEESIFFVVEDPKGVHRRQTFYYTNNEKVDGLTSFKLRLDAAYEAAYFNEIDLKYNNSFNSKESQLIDETTTMDTTGYVSASSQGGKVEYRKYISNTIEYPYDCIEKEIQGVVYLKFIVEVDGTITNVKITKGVSPSIDEEAIKLLYYSPKWIPATLKGNPVRSYFTTKITFKLS